MMDSTYIYLGCFFIVIPCLALAIIVNHGHTNEQLLRACRQQDRHMKDVLHDYLACANNRNTLQAERDKLWLLVYWSVGTTEAALSMSDEYGADEEDVSDAEEKVRELREAIGYDPERDSWEQDPQTYTKVEQERLAIIMRRKENT
jgi:hypothetical protein